MRLSVASTAPLLITLLILALPTTCAFASGGPAIDAASLADLESRAEHAQAKEQCFLYTQLVHDYVEVVGRQLAAGEMDQANASLKRVEDFADRIHMERDTKRLKNAETLMHMATYHLNQFMHLVSSEDMAMLQTTLQRLDKLHDELLAQVFAH